MMIFKTFNKIMNAFAQGKQESRAKKWTLLFEKKKKYSFNIVLSLPSNLSKSHKWLNVSNILKLPKTNSKKSQKEGMRRSFR